MVKEKLKFELVVPAYNEAKNLKLLIERTVQAAQEMHLSSDYFQLVVVENGSRDESAQVLREMKESDLGDWFRIVTVPENRGYGYGLWQGLLSTHAPVIGWSHADLQCDPLNALKAFAMVDSSSERLIVKGERSGRNWKDVVVSRVFELVALVLLGLKVHEMNAQPKVVSRQLLSAMPNPPQTFAFDLYALYCAKKQAYTVKTIPVLFPPRIHGVSNWASSFLGRYKTILGMVQYMYRLARTEGRV